MDIRVEPESLRPKLLEHAAWAARGYENGQAAELADVEISRLEIRHAELAGIWLAGSMVENFVLDEVILSRSSLVEAEWSRGTVTGGSWFKTEANRSEWSQVRFTGVDLIRTEFYKAKLTDVVFDSCQLAAAMFTRAELTDVEFVGCDLNEFDIAEATLTRVTVREPTRVGGIGLEGARVLEVVKGCEDPLAVLTARGDDRS